MDIRSYLTFNGNCREAMSFYQQCLGGELYFQTVGDSPFAEKLPPRMKDCIMHSTLTKDSVVLMASDMVGEHALIRGNSVSMMLSCNSEDEIRACYEKLSKGGKQTHVLEYTFWGALFGDLRDKYGNQWLLHYQVSK
ncbi:VOC family protein [Pontibacter sp. KCTC 32443]|uniref:VOC family protein n=1 Tax=Pontibacter TaxID=323449 RepID=UPI00164CEBD9|nr:MULTISPECIES: VOC family protein [Pontibacter]MBC5774662.1 VOC family protein [Pontibacter sp. KCTC 32443]